MLDIEHDEQAFLFILRPFDVSFNIAAMVGLPRVYCRIWEWAWDMVDDPYIRYIRFYESKNGKFSHTKTFCCFQMLAF